MEPNRFMVRCAVHLFLIKDGKVLVEKRKNREYGNNQYDVIASHIIGNENVFDAIIRTAKVEVNIDVKKEDLKIVQGISSNVTDETIERIKTLHPGVGLVFGNAFKVPLLVTFPLPNPLPVSTSLDVTNLWYQ